jgi:Bifunctional DNA primase/polymerase, N-terminal
MTGFTTKSLSHSMTRFHFRGARRCKWLPVFPCRLDKKPACLNGFKDAATDPGEIRRLWAKYPGPLIGVPSGEISGVDVLDIDLRSGGLSWYQENKQRLPETRKQRTRSGGLHLFFQHLGGLRNSAGKIAPGVDIRADGGYFIHWGAAGLDSRDYPASGIPQWPLWLIPLLTDPPQPQPYPRASAAGDGSALTKLQGIVRDVAAASPGRRNCLVFWAACRIAEMAAAQELQEQWGADVVIEAATRAGLPSREAARAVTSGLARGRQGR